MKIILLSDSTISKIASGETIERPASVVKELVENAIDAVPHSIKITTTRGGLTSIVVEDDGSGINKLDMKLAISRHATSKLAGEDLESVSFLGFRGEALASIATVSLMDIVSKISDEEIAYQISSLSPTEEAIITPASRNTGTTVSVRNLFCFTPNRLRFLKSESVESASSIDIVQRLAVANPHIGFEMTVDDRTVLHCAPSDELKRIEAVLGAEFAQNTVIFEKEIDAVNVRGYATVPTYNRSRINRSFAFVNGRFVKDRLLSGAIKAAYFNLLPTDCSPVVVLFVKVPPQMVDVNVHPNKTQVRFSNERLVKNAIVSSIKSGISQAGIATKFADNFFDSVLQESLNVVRSPNKSAINNDWQLTDITRRPFDMIASHEALMNEAMSKPLIESPKISFTNGTVSLGKAICQLWLRYILAESEDGFVIVDQHAAHERLVLEFMKQQLSKSSYLAKQKLLIPKSFGMNCVEADILESIVTDLEKVGIEIARIAIDLIEVRAMPAIAGKLDMRGLLLQISSHPEIYREITIDRIDTICGEIACYSSIRAGCQLTHDEMNTILVLLKTTEFSSQCNHGRPSHIILDEKHFRKIFESL